MVSPTSLAVCVSISGVITKPQLLMVSAADSTVVPMTAGAEFIAKYRPGSSTQAAISAITATNASISMPP